MNAFVDLLSQDERAQHDQSSDWTISIPRLSEEDLALLRGISSGCSRNALGLEFQLQPDQVNSRIDALFEKIGAQCTADAVRLAILAGL